VKSVSIVGVGRVGGALALGLSKGPYQIDKLIYRTEPARAREINTQIPGSEAVSFSENVSIDSEIVLISTQDSQIPAAAQWLAEHISDDPIVFHTSGALSSNLLDGLTQKGCRTGSIHPLVSISSPETGVEHFAGSFFCLEGHSDAVREGQRMVAALGGVAFTIDTRYKTLYHASAVTACGHLVALFDAALEMMTKCGLSAADAKRILLPLVNSTVENLNEQSTAEALTGTFARADVETFVRHLQALNNVSEDLLEIYLLLGERSLELASKQGVSADRIESLRTKVAIAKSKLKW
jgi:predicted short-subunit dehydrogenase-like oxidoreductase (DUF2520 family)